MTEERQRCDALANDNDSMLRLLEETRKENENQLAEQFEEKNQEIEQLNSQIHLLNEQIQNKEKQFENEVRRKSPECILSNGTYWEICSFPSRKRI